MDAGIDRAAHEVKDQYGNALTNPMISMAANKIKDKLHDTVSDLGEEPEDEPQEEGEHPPKEGEGEKDEGIVGKLIGKVTRRKRSATFQL